ncbi:amidohydrolase [candidate division FCPU426 bacterium]|nr:amidohydrolase [candidate division FCPU426 bacterium]
MRAWRRAIHRWPELGFQEHKTSALVGKVLHQTGWKVLAGVAGTGVVGLLPGSHPGPCFAIRADMDALPLQEQNTCAYASHVAGRMHACGHDGNTAMVLGAAQLLAGAREHLRGSIKLIFQPCEEAPPGGALAMIAAGVLHSPRVEAVIAGHVDTTLPVGTIGVKAGPVMASADVIHLTIQGKGGHGALPHKSIDAIAVAGQVIANLQHLVSREQDPLEPAVLSLGTISGGSAYNVIADRVWIQGTLRTLQEKERRALPRRIARIAKGVARAHRAEALLTVERGHPALVNDSRMTKGVITSARCLSGRVKIKELLRPAMSGEDFTHFARVVPACFFRVGAGGKQKKYSFSWHHPRFDFDERGLIAGAAVLARTALDYVPR